MPEDIKVKLNEKAISTTFDGADYLCAVVDGKLKRIENSALKELFESIVGLRLYTDGSVYKIQYLNGAVWTDTGFEEEI